MIEIQIAMTALYKPLRQARKAKAIIEPLNKFLKAKKYKVVYLAK